MLVAVTHGTVAFDSVSELNDSSLRGSILRLMGHSYRSRAVHVNPLILVVVLHKVIERIEKARNGACVIIVKITKKDSIVEQIEFAHLRWIGVRLTRNVRLGEEILHFLKLDRLNVLYVGEVAERIPFVVDHIPPPYEERPGALRKVQGGLPFYEPQPVGQALRTILVARRR